MSRTYRMKNERSLMRMIMKTEIEKVCNPAEDADRVIKITTIKPDSPPIITLYNCTQGLHPLYQTKYKRIIAAAPSKTGC